MLAGGLSGLHEGGQAGHSGAASGLGRTSSGPPPGGGPLTVRGLAAGGQGSGLSLASGGGKQPMALARDAIAAVLAQGNVAGQARTPLSFFTPVWTRHTSADRASLPWIPVQLIVIGLRLIWDRHVKGTAMPHLMQGAIHDPAGITSRSLGRAPAQLIPESLFHSFLPSLGFDAPAVGMQNARLFPVCIVC